MAGSRRDGRAIRYIRLSPTCPLSLTYPLAGWPATVALWLWRQSRRASSAGQAALDFSSYSLVVYASYRESYRDE